MSGDIYATKANPTLPAPPRDCVRSGAVVHTPDPDNYCYDGSGRFVIPLANDDGTHRIVDHNKAGKVIVDPDLPGGGFTLDIGKLNSSQVQAARRGSPDMFTTVQRLASMQQASTVPQVASQVATVAQPAPNGQHYAYPPATQQAPNGFATPVFQPAAAAPLVPQAPATAQPAIDAQMAAKLLEMSDKLNLVIHDNARMQAELDARAAAAHAAPPMYAPAPPVAVAQPVWTPPVPAPVPVPVPATPAIPESPAVASLPIAVHLPPMPADKLVIFHMGESFGTISVAYHHVSYRHPWLTLYTDTRSGQMQFKPPARADEKIILEIPSLGKRFAASHIGQCDSFGCVDWYTFVVAEVTELSHG